MRCLTLALLALFLAAAASRPDAQVKVPHLIGLDAEDAKDDVEWLGLVFAVDPPGPPVARPYDPALDHDMIVKDQNPAAGGNAAPGSTVSVVLVLPPEPGKMQPALLGLVVLLLLILLFLVLRCCCGRKPG